MRFKALRHQPSDAARKSGYDNEGQLPDTLPDSRSRPGAVVRARSWRPLNAPLQTLGYSHKITFVMLLFVHEEWCTTAEAARTC